MNRIIVKSWGNESFRHRLLADPVPALRAEGVEVMAGVAVRVVEDTDALIHLILPVRPRDPASEGENRVAAVAADDPVEEPARFSCDDTSAPLLERVMAYRNPDVVARYRQELGLTSPDARALFLDIKRFLYLCATTSKPWAPPRRIDQAWHEFIVCTVDYEAFCLGFFGRFIHHEPRRLAAASSDGPSFADTLAAAEKLFGPLSGNWRLGGRDADDIVEPYPRAFIIQDDAEGSAESAPGTSADSQRTLAHFCHLFTRSGNGGA